MKKISNKKRTMISQHHSPRLSRNLMRNNRIRKRRPHKKHLRRIIIKCHTHITNIRRRHLPPRLSIQNRKHSRSKLRGKSNKRRGQTKTSSSCFFQFGGSRGGGNGRGVGGKDGDRTPGRVTRVDLELIEEVEGVVVFEGSDEGAAERGGGGGGDGGGRDSFAFFVADCHAG